MELDHAIVDRVEWLFQRADKLESLLGEVLATLRLNLDRGHLSFFQPDHSCTNTREVFVRLLEQWEAKFKEPS